MLLTVRRDGQVEAVTFGPTEASGFRVAVRPWREVLGVLGWARPSTVVVVEAGR